MTVQPIEGVTYIKGGENWYAKGRPTIIPYVNPLVFSTFAPGTVKPVGHYDDPLGRNIGPRVQDFSELTPVYGDVVIGTGQVVEKVDIFGKVTFTGRGTLRDFRVRGPVWGQGPTYDGAPANDAAINATYNGRGSLIEWGMIDMTGRENVWTDGIRGNNFTMQYTEITRTVDGWGASAGSNHGPTVFRNNRVHNAYYTAWYDPTDTLVQPYNLYPNFPTSPSDRRCHSDGIQMQGFNNYTVDGNYIGGWRAPLGANGSQVKANNRDYLNPAHLPVIRAVDAADDYNNAAIIIQNNIPAGGLVGALVEKNWLAGGDAVVNLNGSLNGDTLANVIVRDNRIIRQSQFPQSDGYNGYAIHRSSGCTATITGNVWDDTGLPVTISPY